MQTDTFSQLLNDLPHLVKLLVADATQKVKIAADGQVTAMCAGTWHAGMIHLDPSAVRRLAEEVYARGERAFMGPWYLRVFSGGGGLSIFAERRPEVQSHLLTPELQQKLRAAVQTGSLGVVAGAPNAAKCSVLLLLAAQLNGDELVFVSEMPPRAPDTAGITHVYPPSTLRERRGLARLLRAHDNVFWNRVDHPDDLRLLLSGLSRNANRWFSLDAIDAMDMAHRLKALIAPLGSPYPTHYVWAERDAAQNAVTITEVVAPGERRAPAASDAAMRPWANPQETAGSVDSPEPARTGEDDSPNSNVAAAAILMPKRTRRSGNYQAIESKPSTGSMPRTHITSNLNSGEFLLDPDAEEPDEGWAQPLADSALTPQAHTEIVDGMQINELLARLATARPQSAPAVPDVLDDLDLDTLAPNAHAAAMPDALDDLDLDAIAAAAARGETAALPPMDLDRIRHLADKGRWGSSEDPS